MSGPYVPLQSWFLSPSNFVALMLYIIGSATIAMLYIIGQYICLGFLRLVLKSGSDFTPTWSYAYNIKKGCPLQNALRKFLQVLWNGLKPILILPKGKWVGNWWHPQSTMGGAPTNWATHATIHLPLHWDLHEIEVWLFIGSFSVRF
jgi:hypothetical protein